MDLLVFYAVMLSIFTFVCRFQRCLAFLLAIATFFGLITLPINMTGLVYSNVPENSLVRTTANNRGPNDDWLFAHTFLAFSLFPIAIYTMRRFSSEMKFRDVTIPVSRTLLIEKIPAQMCVTGSIHHHLEEAYPGYASQRKISCYKF